MAGLEAQLRDLKAVGAEPVHRADVASRAADGLGRGADTITVTKLDCLARSITNLWDLLRQLGEKEVALRILNLALDTNTPTGKIMVTVKGGVAEFERFMMLERQKEGITKAKAECRYKGRKPTARTKAAEVAALASNGMSFQAIANELRIDKASVHLILSRKSA